MTWNPNEPITSWNHPPCDACDWPGKTVGSFPEELPCTCFNWPTSEDDHTTIVKLTKQLKIAVRGLQQIAAMDLPYAIEYSRYAGKIISEIDGI